MQYLDVTLNDLEREFQLARSKPRQRLAGNVGKPVKSGPVPTGTVDSASIGS